MGWGLHALFLITHKSSYYLLKTIISFFFGNLTFLIPSVLLCTHFFYLDGLFSWSRAVQIRTNLDLVLDWLQGAGLGDIASEFMKKLSVTVNFLCIPKTRLIQVTQLHLQWVISALDLELKNRTLTFPSLSTCHLPVILDQSAGGPQLVKPFSVAPPAHPLQAGSNQSPTSILGPTARHRAEWRLCIHKLKLTMQLRLWNDLSSQMLLSLFWSFRHLWELPGPPSSNPAKWDSTPWPFPANTKPWAAKGSDASPHLLVGTWPGWAPCQSEDSALRKPIFVSLWMSQRSKGISPETANQTAHQT